MVPSTSPLTNEGYLSTFVLHNLSHWSGRNNEISTIRAIYVMKFIVRMCHIKDLMIYISLTFVSHIVERILDLYKLFKNIYPCIQEAQLVILENWISLPMLPHLLIQLDIYPKKHQISSRWVIFLIEIFISNFCVLNNTWSKRSEISKASSSF